MLRVFFAACTFSAVLCLGCESKPTGLAPGTYEKDALGELSTLLKSLANEGKKPPSKLAEFDAVEPLMPVGGPAIRNGVIIYIWGTTLHESSTAIIAHEKVASTEGGYVLLQNGEVKKMTADEFNAAPKAKLP